MTLQTDDIVIKNNDWNKIDLLTDGTFVQIVQSSYKILCKTDTTGSTNGFIMDKNDQIKVPQAIYVKTYESNKHVVVTVIRDHS